MVENNLCYDCQRDCKVRNEDRAIKVIECDGYIIRINSVSQTIIQTKLGV